MRRPEVRIFWRAALSFMVGGMKVDLASIEREDAVHLKERGLLTRGERRVHVRVAEDLHQASHGALSGASADEAHLGEVGGHVLRREGRHHASDGDVGAASMSADGVDQAAPPLPVSLAQRDADAPDGRGKGGLEVLEAEHGALVSDDRHLHVGEDHLRRELLQGADHVEDALGELRVVVGRVRVHQGFKEQRPRRRRLGEGRGRWSGSLSGELLHRLRQGRVDRMVRGALRDPGAVQLEGSPAFVRLEEGRAARGSEREGELGAGIVLAVGQGPAQRRRCSQERRGREVQARLVADETLFRRIERTNLRW